MKKVDQIICSSERGSTVVEFALILPILLLILFGIINFGVIFYNQAVITNASREGARWAAIHSSSTFGTSCLNTYSMAPIDPCQVAFSYSSKSLISFGANQLMSSYSAANYSSGSTQSVTVTYAYLGIGWFFSGQALKQYSATSVMLHE